MKRLIKKFAIKLGKMDEENVGKYNHPVILKVELREHEKLVNGELSICGEVWLPSRRDVALGGQCYDSIDAELMEPEYRELFLQIKDVWKRWHLNAMRAGNQVQTDALVKANLFRNGSYEDAVAFLKENDLYEVDGYKFGHAWCKEELPQEVLDLLEKWSKLNEA